MKLKDKVAVITGAGQGIGRGIALRLAQEGANVVINYPSAEVAYRAVAVAEEVQKTKGKAIICQADVAKAAEVQTLIAKTIETFGRLDIQVNNAGVDNHIPFLQMTEAQWDFIIDTNLKGNYLCCQTAAREMIKTGGGKIIIISSIHSLQTYPHVTAYAAAKG